MVGQNHPNRFKLNDHQDLYGIHGKLANIWQIQEIAYKYDDVQIKDTVKPYNRFNNAKYPSNLMRAVVFKTYKKLYIRLTQQQKIWSW